MAASLDYLTVFDRIRLANSAMKRAELNVFDETRFIAEYNTAKLWMRHKVVTTPYGNYQDL